MLKSNIEYDLICTFLFGNSNIYNVSISFQFFYIYFSFNFCYKTLNYTIKVIN